LSVTSSSIRRAELTDLEALHRLIEAAYRGPESLTGWTSEGHIIDGQRMTSDQVAGVLSDHNTTMLLAESHDGTIIGCAAITTTQQGAEFGKFAVRPALQNGGTGKRLLAACEAVLADRGGGLMTMTVIEGRTELSAFYERRGYQRTGERLALAAVHDTPDWRIGRDLMLEVFSKPIAATA
jgi:N-acetylglutamate synthase-like GNAT family acetyltransferase